MVISSPDTVKSPDAIILPVPVVEIFPEVEMVSPVVVGEIVVAVRFQKPESPLTAPPVRTETSVYFGATKTSIDPVHEASTPRA